MYRIITICLSLFAFCHSTVTMNKRGDLLMNSLLGGDVVLSSGSGNIVAEHFGNRINILEQLETAQKVAGQICWFSPNSPLPQWNSYNDLPDPAWGITTVTVGSNIYVIGGATQSGILSSNRRFDANSGNWTILRPMTTKRSYAFGGVSADGSYIYIFGGYDATTDSDMIASSERYDIDRDTWSSVQFNVSSSHWKGSSVTVGDIIFFLGGKNKFSGAVNNVVSSYNTRTGDSKPWTPMPNGRYNSAAAAISNRIYVIGGRDETNTLTPSMYMFDTQTGAWFNRSEFGLPRENMVALSFNGLVGLIGGFSEIISVGSSPTVTVLNPRMHSWKTNVVGPLTTKRDSFGLAFVNGIIYAIGGRNNTATLQTKTVEGIEPCF